MEWAYSHVFEISVEKKQNMANYSPQRLHINEKKTKKTLKTVPMTFQ